MEKRDRADDLITSLSSVEPLEEVPSEVSKRFHETLSHLANEQTSAVTKTRWFNSANQFALAASFVLVFALGAVVTLNTGNNSVNPLDVVKPQSSASSNTDITDDEIQYSGGDKSIPIASTDLIKQTESSHDYAEIPMDFYKKLGVGYTFKLERLFDK